eukprot:9495997-Pyramimonas_sp.AAC.1
MCRALAVVADVFASRGHLLNLGVTTTAALLAYRGKVIEEGEAARVVRVWWACGFADTATSDLIDPQGNMGPEVRYRASSITATLRVLRTRVFSTKALADPACMRFAGSLVLSGRFCNSGAWAMLTTAEANMAGAGVMKVYRAAAK